jgi:uncharacterized protein
MRIFVTGATGLIGRALILRLLGGGHQVSAWVRNEARAANLLGAEVKLVGASDRAPALSEQIAAADAVVNLAGEPVLGGRWTERRRRALRQSRIAMTSSIVDAIKRSSRRPAVLISASAVGYYGDRGDEPLDERSAPGNDFLAALCREWEECAMGAQAAGVRVFIPRIGIVLGLDGGALAQMLPPFQFGAGGPIGSGRQWMAWIHLHDLVEVIAVALEDERWQGPAIAAAPSPVSNREFAHALGHVLHRPSFIPIPRIALRTMFGQGAAVLTSGQKAYPARLSQLGYQFSFDTVDAALRNLLAEDDPEIRSLDANSPQPENPSGSGYLHTRRPVYLMRAATRIAAPIAEAFTFFSRPQNLGVMTPADMRFRITSTPPEMSAGARIEYTLRAAMLPIHWRTRIEAWQPQRFFADSQERGPYRAWWHEHHFKPDGAATLMEDRVYFAPPLGILGRAASYPLVMPQLRRIFRFRTQAMRLRFRAQSDATASASGRVS